MNSIKRVIPEKDLHVNASPIKYREVDGCWVNEKFYRDNHKTGRDYYYVTRNGKLWRAHRYVYELLKEKIPEGQVLRHICHNPPCINPDHLKPGNQHDNMMDSVNDGLFKQGKESWKATLTKEKFFEIMELLLKTRDNHTATVARKVGVSEWMVKHIRFGNHWACDEWGQQYDYPIVQKRRIRPPDKKKTELIKLDLKEGLSNRVIRTKHDVSSDAVLKIKKSMTKNKEL